MWICESYVFEIKFSITERRMFILASCRIYTIVSQRSDNNKKFNAIENPKNYSELLISQIIFWYIKYSLQTIRRH